MNTKKTHKHVWACHFASIFAKTTGGKSCGLPSSQACDDKTKPTTKHSHHHGCYWHTIIVHHFVSSSQGGPQNPQLTLQSVLSPILNDKQHELLEKEQQLLTEFVNILQKAEAIPQVTPCVPSNSSHSQDIETLKNSISQLNDLFLLVVVGEFNSGKSSFLNALLGDKYLDDGVTPTTSKIDTLRYGPRYTLLVSR